MILVKPSFEIMTEIGIDSLKLIEQAGKTCYKSENTITNDSAKGFCRKIIKRGHLSVIEHVSVSVKFIIDRGVSHELVRHRLCAFSQESTRYCNYKNDGITVVNPFFFDPFEEQQVVQIPPEVKKVGYKRWAFSKQTNLVKMNSFDVWFITCLWAEWGYTTLVNQFERSPQEARSVLPNSLKTEIVTTANLREWKHIFNLRCSKAAHPQMREVMIPLREEFRKMIPVIFNDELETEETEKVKNQRNWFSGLGGGLGVILSSLGWRKNK